jgi:hypothetical protein
MTITYKAYMIDAFEREQDRWRATIRRQDGMRIWVAVPPSEHESVTKSADALTAKGAIDLAKQAIDGRRNDLKGGIPPHSMALHDSRKAAGESGPGGL